MSTTERATTANATNEAATTALMPAGADSAEAASVFYERSRNGCQIGATARAVDDSGSVAEVRILLNLVQPASIHALTACEYAQNAADMAQRTAQSILNAAARESSQKAHQEKLRRELEAELWQGGVA